MKKTKILKTLIVLIMGMILFTMSTSVFALDDSDSDLNFYEDTSDQLETNTNTNTNANANTNANTNTSTNTNINTNTNTNVDTNVTTNSNNYNTSLPKAGAPENALVGISITVLAITAVYAYRKTREYKNI